MLKENLENLSKIFNTIILSSISSKLLLSSKLLSPGLIAFEPVVLFCIIAEIIVRSCLLFTPKDSNNQEANKNPNPSEASFVLELLSIVLIVLGNWLLGWVQGTVIGLIVGTFTGEVLHSIYFASETMFKIKLTIGLCVYAVKKLVDFFMKEEIEPPASTPLNAKDNHLPEEVPGTAIAKSMINNHENNNSHQPTPGQ